MRFPILHIAFLLLMLNNQAVQGEVRSISFGFYTEKIQLHFNTDLLLLPKPSVEGKSLKNHYALLLKTAYQGLIADLKLQRDAYALNDWLFYEMLRAATDQILSGRSLAEKNLLIWFCLSESGFDTRVTFRDQRVFVCVFTKDEIYEVPLIEDQTRTFVNITALENTKGEEAGVFLLDFAPKRNGKAFSFHLGEFLASNPLSKKEASIFPIKGKFFHWR